MSKPHPQSLLEAKYLLDSFGESEMALHRDFVLKRDADATNALALQLEQLKNKVVERKYSIVQSMEILPVNTDVSLAYDSIAWQEMEHSGQAKIITPENVTDLPTVESKKAKQTAHIYPVAAAYHFDQFQLQRAATLGHPLPSNKAVRARDAIDRKLDEILALGDADTKLGGFINDSNVSSASASANFGTTFDDDLSELNTLANALVNSSDEAWADSPAELILSRNRFQAISQLRASADNGETVLQAFLRANPWVQRVRTWQRLSTAGAGSSERAVLWYPTPMVAEAHVGAFEQMPPERKGLGFQVPVWRPTAGVTVYQPLGIRYLDAI